MTTSTAKPSTGKTLTEGDENAANVTAGAQPADEKCNQKCNQKDENRMPTGQTTPYHRVSKTHARGSIPRSSLLYGQLCAVGSGRWTCQKASTARHHSSAMVLDAAKLRRASGEQDSLGIPDPAAHAHQAVGGDGALMVDE